MTITLTPENPPILIPVSGGSFNFNIAVENLESTPELCDVWTEVTLPDGSTYGPIINAQSVTIPANTLADRDRTQYVPATAPEGSYMYHGYVGNYPDDIWSSDEFAFVKDCPAENSGGNPVYSWGCVGEGFEEFMETDILPTECALISAYPNPFNPECTINLSLQQATDISLNIYDIQGRLVESLLDGWYAPGIYDVAFDGSALSSGTYFALLKTNETSQTMKLVLIK